MCFSCRSSLSAASCIADSAGTVSPRAKAAQFLDKLFDSLETMEEAGGITVAANTAGWSPKARKRAEASLIATKEAIERQLGQLQVRKRP